MSNYYILEGKTPKKVSLMEWARWYEKANRHAGKTTIGEVTVSTVFLGLDHSWDGKIPILFETMIFGDDKFEDYQERYSTWDEAIEGHNKAVALIKSDPKFYPPLNK